MQDDGSKSQAQQIGKRIYITKGSNMAHIHGRPDNQQETFDDLLGRGRGDPDVYGYPGESGVRPKVLSQNTKRRQPTGTSRMSGTSALNPKCTGPKSRNL